MGVVTVRKKRQDHIEEGSRQLEDEKYYGTPEEDSTRQYNAEILPSYQRNNQSQYHTWKYAKDSLQNISQNIQFLYVLEESHN